MRLGEHYDIWLDEVYGEDFDNAPDWMKKFDRPSAQLEDGDPIMYRCGYADWAQTEQFKGCQCDICDEDLDDDDVSRLVSDCASDDEFECRVCAGEAFKCSECDEVCTVDDNEDALSEICDECMKGEDK